MRKTAINLRGTTDNLEVCVCVCVFSPKYALCYYIIIKVFKSNGHIVSPLLMN